MKKKKSKKNRNIFIYLLLFISLILIYSRYIEPYWLKVNEYKIENNIIPSSFNGIKIVQFSDVHYGRTVDLKYLKKIVNLINLQKPDLVFFTGDFIDKDIKLSNEELENIKEELNKIESTLGNYAVTGNHDIKQLSDFKTIIDNNFILLNNEEKIIYYKDNEPISIIGLSDMSETEVNYEVFNNKNNYYKIILAHEPDEIINIKQYNINLMLSGHSHGGQVRIPFIGTIFTPKGSKQYYDEYYKVDDIDLYISNGIGTSKINFRFLSQPSINLYRLYSE